MFSHLKSYVDEDNNLHNVKGMAIQLPDDSGIYAIHGKPYDKQDYDREIIRIKNSSLQYNFYTTYLASQVGNLLELLQQEQIDYVIIKREDNSNQRFDFYCEKKNLLRAKYLLLLRVF